MRGAIIRTIGFTALLLVGSSQVQLIERSAVVAGPITITATPVAEPLVQADSPLRFVKAWRLQSSFATFGGISAVLRDAAGFTAISDAGSIIRFKISGKGAIFGASVAPLPTSCTRNRLKYSLDAESVTLDLQSGDVFIGFEWRNVICKADAAFANASAMAAPPAMKSLPATGGPEAIVALRDGRFVVIGERPAGDGSISPVLIFDRDPTDPAARVTRAGYVPPDNFRPTDIAQLPDGRLIIVNRRYSFPLTFSTIVTIVTPSQFESGTVARGFPVARIARPGIADNFEAVAISVRSGRTFVWLMSDDNFIAFQTTYLVLFEVRDQ